MRPLMRVRNGISVTTTSSTVYSSTCSRVWATPCVTGNIGMPARAYSSRRAIASAQKCGGVQMKMMRNSSNAFGSMLLVTAAQPSAGRAADHDVLRGCTLEPHCVDDCVADERCKSERGGQQIDQKGEDRHRRHAEHRGEDECLSFGQLPGRQRPRPGPRHLLIDASVKHMIDGRGAAGGERDTEISPQQSVERRPARTREQRPHDCRECNERDDLRLRQFEVT